MQPAALAAANIAQVDLGRSVENIKGQTGRRVGGLLGSVQQPGRNKRRHKKVVRQSEVAKDRGGKTERLVFNFRGHIFQPRQKVKNIKGICVGQAAVADFYLLYL